MAMPLRPVVLLSLALMLGCGDAQVPAPPVEPAPSGWHVSDGTLRAPGGRAVILRGANVASAHKSSPYFGFHQLADYERMRSDWSMNAVRLLILWAAIEPEEGVYDDSYLDALQQRLDWAEQAGLWVVLDMHQDLYGEGFGGDGAPRWTCDAAHYQAYEPISPWFLNYLNEHVTACIDGFWNSSELQAHYAEAWRRIAERFVDHPAVIGFDVMNEPYWGSVSMAAFEAEKLQPFYELVVPIVRQQAPGWVAFLEPSASRNIGLPTGLTPFPFANVVYAPHSYDPDAEGGDGFDPAHRDGLIIDISNMSTEANALGAALWIGEYGGVPTDPGIDDYMDAQYDGIASVVGGAMYWAYDQDGGYGLLDADGNEKANLLDVLVRPYPEFVAGTPISASFDEDTRTFTLDWQPDGSDRSSEILLPERVYPMGYQVRCDGCETEQRPGRLLVTVAGGAPRTLVVTPDT